MWHREALVLQAEGTLTRLMTARASMYKADDYESIVSRFRRAINEIRIGARETIKNNWLSLRRGV